MRGAMSGEYRPSMAHLGDPATPGGSSAAPHDGVTRVPSAVAPEWPGWAPVAYGVAMVLLFLPSAGFWFLPAGLRMAALWAFPVRQWPWLMLAEALAIAFVSLLRGDSSGWIAFVLASALPMTLYATVMALLPAHWRRERGDHGLFAWRLMAAGALAALLTSLYVAVREQDLTLPVLGAAIRAEPGSALGPGLLDAAPWFALGDFIGVMVLTPLLLTLLDQHLAPKPSATPAFERLLALLPAAAYLGSQWLLGSSHVVPPVAMSAALLLACAYRLDWTGALAANLMLSMAIYVTSMLGHTSPAPHELQLFAIVVVVAALQLAAASDRMRTQMRQAIAAAQQLSSKSAALREASGRLVQLQEQERRRIGRDLHGALGQSLSEARTLLRLSRRDGVDPQDSTLLDQHGAMVNQAKDEPHAVITSLHTAEVSRDGIAEALREGQLRQVLHDAGLRYDCMLDLQVPLALPVASSLYRICQDMAALVIEAGRARATGFHLRSWRDEDGTPCCELRQLDDGGRWSAGFPAGPGLQDITDRALAIGAEHRVDRDSGEPRHVLRLALRRPAAG